MSDTARRRLLIALAALPAACASPAYIAAPAAPVAPPRVRAGDRWRYALTNAYNGQTVAEVTQQVAQTTPQLRLTAVDGQGNALHDEVYAAPWVVVQESLFDRLQVYEQPVPLVPPQSIAAGSGENTGVYYAIPEFGPRRFWWSQLRRAPGWERITVPAGTFDCLRIERQVTFQHSDVFRMGSSRFDTLWYAPQANRWVRRHWTGRYLLPGGRRAVMLEDAVTWNLLEYVPAPVAG